MNHVPVVVCVFGLQCDAVVACVDDIKIITVDIVQFFSDKHAIIDSLVFNRCILIIVYTNSSIMPKQNKIY